jgi:CheY-like chemotaxis protein
MRIALEQAGHSVHIFPDGPSVLAEIVDLKPDAVVLDIGLPGLDGYQVAAQMKKRPEMREATFIALSGFKRREQGGKTADDFDHYLTKPVDVRALLALLEKSSRVRPTDKVRKNNGA